MSDKEKKVKRYQKMPVIVEACEINRGTEHEINIWSKGAVYSSPVLEPTKDNPDGAYWQIKTLEGIMTAITGDFIIKGVKGEFYPCKPDIFKKTYKELTHER